MGALLFSHVWVTNVKLINEKNYLNITVWMFVNPQKSILLLRLLRSFYNSLHWGCSAYSKVVVACTWSPRTCGATGCGGGGCNNPLPFLLPTFFELVGILTKYVGKISWPNVVVKFGVLYYKKRNAEFYQYPVPQKSNFYRWWRLLKNLYRICTDD